MDDYVEALCRELDAIYVASARGNWNLAWPDQNFPVENPEPKELTSIYIGGGTPTVLTETQLEKLLKKISQLFDLSKIKEFTLEAGRPDTINEAKLKIAKDSGITRLSINPQTMQQKTLERSGFTRQNRGTEARQPDRSLTRHKKSRKPYFFRSTVR